MLKQVGKAVLNQFSGTISGNKEGGFIGIGFGNYGKEKAKKSAEEDNQIKKDLETVGMGSLLGALIGAGWTGDLGFRARIRPPSAIRNTLIGAGIGSLFGGLATGVGIGVNRWGKPYLRTSTMFIGRDGLLGFLKRRRDDEED